MSNYMDVGVSLIGRKKIFSSTDEITADNIINILNECLAFHVMNLLAEDYLYFYRRGITPILQRSKDRNSFINNKINENHAEEIVSFKNGYFLTQPCFYVARSKKSGKKVEQLNEYLYRSGKQQADNEVADWFHTVGKAAIMVKPTEDEEVPIKVYALDPRSAFVVYSMSPGNEPVMGVNMVIVGDTLKFDAYTKDYVFRLTGTKTGTIVADRRQFVATAVSVDDTQINTLGRIPIIEYQYNSTGMGAFESVIPLLDAINTVQSNRVDGIEQFIQSIAIAVNCQFDDDVTADEIRQSGMIALKSVGDNKADFKILSEELDQSQTQVLVDYLYQQVLTIAALPSTVKGGTSTSDTGTAVYLRDGFAQADMSARNTEDLFKKSNKYFDEIFVDVLRSKGLLDIKMSDFELNFVRNSTSNMQSKAQTLQTLLSAGLNPVLALSRSGVSSDPVGDYSQSEKYFKMIWGDAESKDPAQRKGEATIIEENRSSGSGGIGV